VVPGNERSRGARRVDDASAVPSSCACAAGGSSPRIVRGRTAMST
jgi:hypothetical protein